MCAYIYIYICIYIGMFVVSLHESRSISMCMSPIRTNAKPLWQAGTLRPIRHQAKH